MIIPTVATTYYISNMLEDLFKPFECTINRAGGNNATVVSYRIKCPVISLDTSFSWASNNNLEAVLKPRIDKLMAVLSNGTEFNERVVYDSQLITELIENNYVKLTPDAKLNTILEYLSKLTIYDGQAIKLKIPPAINIVKMYFYNVKEWRFYLDNAISQGYIAKNTVIPLNADKYIEHTLTVAGLSRLIQVSEGRSSNYCFIAMAFVDDMFVVLDTAIKVL